MEHVSGPTVQVYMMYDADTSCQNCPVAECIPSC